MEIKLEPGKYVIAVSGGVDSVVLLHLLAGLAGLKLTVAHFDHGIRPDSADDRAFVADLAQIYGLPFVSANGGLGPDASEAAARLARYEFLHSVWQTAGAQAIVTAHHLDDVLETVIFNIVRGTGRRGLTSLRSTTDIKRPLLGIAKAEIVRYARANRLEWREDSTNATDDYARNYIRHQLLPYFSPGDRARLQGIIVGLNQVNGEIDELLQNLLNNYSLQSGLDRRAFILLPHTVARELMAVWLRQNDVADIDKKMLERLVRAAKTYTSGKRAAIQGGWYMDVGKGYLALVHIER